VKRLWWALRERGVAVPVLTSAALLVFTLVVHAVLVPQLQAELQALRARPPSARSVLAPPQPGPAEQLHTFYRHFESSDSLAAQLKTLYRVANEHHIAMPQGEYRLLPSRDTTLRQYQITLPIQGSYPAVRRFVGAVLQQVPVAALDQVTFERRNVGDVNVQARVQITLFLPAT